MNYSLLSSLAGKGAHVSIPGNIDPGVINGLVSKVKANGGSLTIHHAEKCPVAVASHAATVLGNQAKFEFSVELP